MMERSPFITTHQLQNGEEINVTLCIDGLIPHSASPEKAENGTIDIQFSYQGLHVAIVVKDGKTGKETRWRYRAVRLPSPIEKHRCSWRIEKDCVILTLFKKKPDGETEHVDWYPKLVINGLDQYDSSEDRSDEGFEDLADEKESNYWFPNGMIFR